MVTPTLEALALIEHFLSFFGDCFTFYFNVNSEILFLCILNMSQHVLKITRIIFNGFMMENASKFTCYYNAFFNFFSMNASLSAACLLIYTLYAAMVHPLFFSKYYKRLRPYIYIFIIVYTAIYCFVPVYEPVIIGYDSKYISEQSNCSSAYRSKFYQYLFGSSFFNLPFTLPVIYCSIVIIHRIVVVPRSFIKKQIATNTKMSFTRWIKILCYAVFLSLLSYLNLYSDIKKGIEAEKNIKKEQENLGYTYFITASSGILIFLFTNSRNQIKRKFGIKVKNDDSINDDTEYILPSSYSVSATTTATSKVSEKSSVNDAQSPTLANISLFQNKMNNEIQSHTGASANTSIYQNSKSNEMRSPTLSVGNSSFYQNKSPSEMRSKTLSVSNFYLHKLDNEIRANTSFNYKRMTNEIRSPVNTSFNQNIISNELHSPVVASAANTSFNQDK